MFKKNINRKILAFESRLKLCENVLTLGVKPNFDDYNNEEKKIINSAKTIYYPSIFYVNLLEIFGKKVFPNASNYYCAQDKIRQTTLFKMFDLPHPRTLFFYGNKQKEKILDFFRYPFIAKIPKGSSLGRGVFLIRNKRDLEEYLQVGHVAYIQEYLPISRDIRVVVIAGRVVHAYWRIIRPGEFRSNVALGGQINLDSIPSKVLKLALNTSIKCGWNDVGIDICKYNERLYLLEANMKYGYDGFKAAGIDYFKFMENMIASEYI